MAGARAALAQLGEADEALRQIRLAEQVIERFATTRIVGHLAWSYQALGRAALLLGRSDEARRLGDRAVEFSPHHPGFAAMRYTCSARSRPIPIASMPRTAKLAAVRR